MMGVSLNDVLSELPVDSQARVEAEAERMYEEYMTLQQLRKAHEMTQGPSRRSSASSRPPSRRWRSAAIS